VTRLTTGLAALTSACAAFLVLLIYTPALDAPFLVPKFAVLNLTASLGFLVFAVQRAETNGLRWNRAVTAGVFLVLATSLLSWFIAANQPPGAPYAVAAMARWGAFFGVACGASLLADAPAARQRVLEAVTIAAAVVAGIGLLQHVELWPLPIPVISKPGSTFGNRNLAAEVMAMGLPLGMGAAARSKQRDTRIVLRVSLAFELIYLAVTRTRGAWLAAACALGAALWLGRVRVSRPSLFGALGVLFAAGLAATLPGRYNPRDAGDAKRYAGLLEVLHEGLDARSTALKTRFGLWRRSLSMVHDHPIWGVGPGNWPVIFPRYAEPGAMRDGVLSATLVPRQAHDDPLERAAETGLPGFAALLFLVGAVATAARHSLQTDDDERPHIVAAAASLVALAVLSLSSFPLEMPGTLALGGISLGLVVVDPERSARLRTSRVTAYPLVLAGMGLVVLAATDADRAIKASRQLGDAERAMHKESGPAGTERALASLKRMLDLSPNDFRARLLTAHLLLRAGQPAAAARSAHEILTFEPYSPNAWTARAAAELAQGEHAAARRSADEALSLLHDDPQALEIRAEASAAEGDLGASQADSQHLAELASGPDESDTTRAARALLHRAK
jgi:O-antigen ligase